MMDRRKFIIQGSMVSAGLLMDPKIGISQKDFSNPGNADYPLVISTWDFGFNANTVAWKLMSAGGRALDAVEEGIRVIEADADNMSVGIGGLPDREGIVTLDACIMDENGQAGSVTFLSEIVHPISIARLVMEKTPHVMLSGDGALQFALENGFERHNLLTDKARKAWEEWKVQSHYQPVINIENHDTVGLLAMDQNGNISGGCSTSGLAFKMHGRVGDSPIIGAGLYVDNEVGAAVATGLGELVMRALSSFLVVELMRNGATPQEACQEAIQRIAKKNPDFKDYQVGLLALNKSGQSGAFALQSGFRYAIHNQSLNEVVTSSSYI
ncbi:MAG: N(4)-(beta-N-acetylglucosaminyl)-L-asparaginase [Bacteroidales bacterium]|nr:N(4)-(beta-N-acetylglucosaminyl)-L-asparaginase [Bacteroidales bacterium]